jgi:uncharacterized repeat protein (TIGR03803 family)
MKQSALRFVWGLLALALATPAAQATPTLNALTNLLGQTQTGLCRPTSLVQSNGAFYVTTDIGGVNQYGSVVQVMPSGAITTLHSFTGNDGQSPNSLTVGPDGALYGTTGNGGRFQNGTVFRVTTGGAFTSLHSFDYTGGAGPYSLITGSDGALYGTTSGGGTGNGGTVFRITVSGTLTTVYAFPGSTLSSPSTLIQGGDGALYGIASAGASAAIYRLTTTGQFNLVHKMSPAQSNGLTSLIQGVDGALYGTAYSTNAKGGFGTVFKVTTAGAYTLLYTFHGGSRCGHPIALTQGNDGSLYATTLDDPKTATPAGLFKITLSGVATLLYKFDRNQYWQPSGLIWGSDGVCYGTTLTGGLYGAGRLFRVTPDGTVTALCEFPGGIPARGPISGLVQSPTGILYATTSVGGTSACGTVFNATLNGVVTISYNFTGGSGPSNLDEIVPAAGLIPGKDGAFYGTTRGGGDQNLGTIYRIGSSGPPTVLYRFTGSRDGAVPASRLVLGRDGAFYGTTSQGGADNAGTVFRITSAGALKTLYGFTGGSDGASPEAGLIQASDGNFYGTTYGGGASNAGTVFKITPSGQFTSLYSFTGGNDGSEPGAELVQGSDSALYGTTYGGGVGNSGTVFKITPSGQFTSVWSFTGGQGGAMPNGLMLANDGAFYGTTQYGGNSTDAGTLFRFTVAQGLTHLYTFLGSTDGANPTAALIQGSDGNFYGTTGWTVFRYTVAPSISSFTPTHGPAGTLVTVSGNNFTGAQTVLFNGISASFTVVNDSTITATVPSGAKTGKISVTNSYGQGSSVTSFAIP